MFEELETGWAGGLFTDTQLMGGRTRMGVASSSLVLYSKFFTVHVCICCKLIYSQRFWVTVFEVREQAEVNGSWVAGGFSLFTSILTEILSSMGHPGCFRNCYFACVFMPYLVAHQVQR